MATIGQALTVPESGWKRYDDSSSAISYSSGWTSYPSGQTGNYNSSISLSNVPNSKARLKFRGTKFRLIALTHNDATTIGKISIDGVVDTVSFYSASATNLILVYEKTNLQDAEHIVEIYTTEAKQIRIDAIDIDSNGRLLHPDEVSDPKNLSIGKRIRANYSAANGVTGLFTGLGYENSDFIPIASSATPAGDFYFIHVDNDFLGRKVLIADRVIQNNIKWDTLNTSGFANSTGLALSSYLSANDLTTGKTTYGSGFDANSMPAKAIDNNSNTNWYGTGAGGTTGDRVIVDMGAPTVVNTVSLNFTQYGCNAFKIQYSDDNTTFYDAYSGTATILTKQYYTFNSVGAHRYWAFQVLSTFSGGSSAIYEIEMFNIVDLPFKYSVRMPTGGVVSTDTDNEWDKYITYSTLNGTITAGDVNFWNSGTLYTLTSTTYPSTPASRVSRATTDKALSAYGNAVASTAYANSGFRPILTIEALSYTKYLIQDGNNLFTYNSTTQTWTNLGSAPTKSLFDSSGMDDLNIAGLRKSTTFNKNYSNVGTLGNGKTFQYTLNFDLSNVTNIKL